MSWTALLSVLFVRLITGAESEEPNLRDQAPEAATITTVSHSSNVRERLVQANAATLELVRNARGYTNAQWFAAAETEDRRGRLLGFAQQGDEVRYLQQRPWARTYLRKNNRFFLPEPPPRPWPTPAEGPELRQLLSDPDPAIRCLSMEALASLAEPEDVPRIAALLDDEADGLPALTQTQVRVSFHVNYEPLTSDGQVRINLRFGWYPRTVRNYARVVLRHFTGEGLESRTFAAWWEHNRGGRQSVWYWRERLHRELQEAMAPRPAVSTNGVGQIDLVESTAAEAQRARVIQTVSEELSRLPAEVEAKVRLLTINQQSTGLGVDLGQPLLGSYDCQRLPPERLLDLLDRKSLWPDVDWGTVGGWFQNYNVLVAGLGCVADHLFRPEYVGRLKAVRVGEYWLRHP